MATTLKPFENVSIHVPSVVVTPPSTSFHQLAIHNDVTIILTGMQIFLALTGLIVICPYGVHILSFNQYYNTFWIAGPVG